MKKSTIILLGFLVFAFSCQKKKDANSHYTVYQAGQTGGMAGMDMGNHEQNKPMLSLNSREIMLANIKTEPLKNTTFSNEIILTGKVDFDPAKTRTISAWVSGRITKLYINNPGEFITKGEKLYDLYSPDLLSAQRDYLIALQQGNLLEGNKSEQNSTIRALKQRLLRYGLSEVQIKQLIKNKRPQSFVSIYSKDSGYLTKKLKDEGDFVNEGESIFTIINNRTLLVQAQNYDTNGLTLNSKSKLWIEIPALPNRKIKAQWVKNDPVMKDNARFYLTNLSVENLDNVLQPGMLAYVHIQTETANPVASVPLSSIIYEKGKTYIWMVMPSTDKMTMDKMFMRMPIEIGKADETHVEVLKGMKPGEIVVTQGVYLLNSEYVLHKNENGGGGMAGMKM